ncbi:MAG: 6-bladed beta-propeller [Candidatus Omnitrophica bacterium]|nr:6-bladed beta-propeller [Candidatus Omnitrophota bacterium]
MKNKRLTAIFGFLSIGLLLGADFSVSPDVFSPGESSGVKDRIVISGTMEQTLPVKVDIYPKGYPENVQKRIPFTDFKSDCGYLEERAVWDGKNDAGEIVPDGEYELKFSALVNYAWSKANATGQLPGTFETPLDVAIGSDGRIYVLEAQRIQVFDSNRNYLFSIKNPSSPQAGQWVAAVSIAAGNNRLYILDCQENNIKIFDAAGQFIRSFGGYGSTEGRFNLYPIWGKEELKNNLAVDANGRVWVVDRGNSRIQVFDADGNFLFKFGSPGTGNGQFNFEPDLFSPTVVVGNIALDENGNAYVTDTGEGWGRIQVFNSQGVFQRGIKSSLNGGNIPELTDIRGPIAIFGPQKRIAIASFDRNAICILNNDGSYRKTLGRFTGSHFEPGRQTGEFQFITSLRGTANHLYAVECFDNPRVQVFDSDGNFTAKLGMAAGEFLTPAGVAVKAAQIYVCDQRQGKIEVFDKDGQHQSQIIIPYVPSHLTYQSLSYAIRPSHITLDEEGKIYVSDTNFNGIAILNNSGSLLGYFLIRDSGYSFWPSGVAISGNYLYVAGNNLYENQASRILVYSKNGVYQKSIAFSPDVTNCKYKDIVARNGNLYVLTADENPYFDLNPGLLVFDTNGTLVDTLQEIKSGAYLAIDNTGNIYVSQCAGRPVKVFNSEGELSFTFGEWSSSEIQPSPTSYQGLAVDGQGNIYLVDEGSHRLHKYVAGEEAVLATKTVKVDNTQPVATIIFPSESPVCNFLQDFFVLGTARDQNFEDYRVFLDNTLVNTGTTPVTNGVLAKISLNKSSSVLHTLCLSVQDLAGNTQQDTVIFYTDATIPSSSVNSLSPYTRTTSFEVSWSGSDPDSGIGSYDIQFRDGTEGVWKNWLVGTCQTEATFVGEDGHTYYFRSRARDKAGNREDYPDGYDTFTQVDATAPQFEDISPPDNAYIGSQPIITMKIVEPNNGSGLSFVSVYKNGWPLSSANNDYTFEANTGELVITTTFTPAIHEIKVRAWDKAGNQSELVLHYDALNFQGTVTNLVPDPNPEVSEIMIGGEAIRWYQVVAQDGKPVCGVSLTIEWENNGKKRLTTNSSDQYGLVACKIPSSSLGQDGDTVTCNIVEAGNQVINPPLSFTVKISPRRSVSEFRFGGSVKAKEATGAGLVGGGQKEVSYKLINTDLQSQADDRIELERQLEVNGGIIIGGSVGLEMGNNFTAEAEAELAALGVFQYGSKFVFEDPYSSQERIRRAGLLLDSLLTGISINPLLEEMISFVASQYDYPNYKDEEKFSFGVRVEGAGSAGSGVQLLPGNTSLKEVRQKQPSENSYLGVRIGTGISGEAEVLASVVFAGLNYQNNQFQPTEIGSEYALSGQLDLFAGAEGNVIGEEIGAKLEGEFALEYKLAIFADPVTRTFTRGELKISHLGETSSTYQPDTEDITRSVILALDAEQIQSLADVLSDVQHLKQYLQDVSPTETEILVGPVEVAERFNILCEKLTAYLATTGRPIRYLIEEKVCRPFKLDPSFEIGAGIKVGLEFELIMDKSVTFTREEGIFGLHEGKVRMFPLAAYKQDSYLPSCSTLDFSVVYQDCLAAITEAMQLLGALVIQSGQQVGETIVTVYHYVSDAVKEQLGSWSFFKNTPEKQDNSDFGQIFSFSPEEPIAELSAGLAQPGILVNGLSTIQIYPGQPEGTVTIHYQTVSEALEDNLLVYFWDRVNQEWVPLESVVDKSKRQVSATISSLGTFTLGLKVPSGKIILSPTSYDVELGTTLAVEITSQPITMTTGELVPDRTLVTVSCFNKFSPEGMSFGTIITPDAEPQVEGIQIATKDGVISFAVLPPETAGTVVIRARSVGGNASGETYFRTLAEVDTDNDGLPDYWERIYFGGPGCNPQSDEDEDGLTNEAEYANQTHPLRADTDSDGIDDAWEVSYHLNPLVYDGELDLDRDGYINWVEYQFWSDPQDRNSIPGLRGDLNKDTRIDVLDAILCLRQVVGLARKHPLADISEDGAVDVKDVILLFRRSLGLD